jgi:carbon storage regulator
MLVLSRKAGESIHIDGQIKVMIVTVSGNRVKVGIEAPLEVPIVRSELQSKLDWNQTQRIDPSRILWTI